MGYLIVSNLGADDPGIDDPLGTEPTTFSDHGLSFDIPAGLHLFDAKEKEQVQITGLPQDIKSPTNGPWFAVLGIDGSNMLIVFPDDLPWVIDETNLEQYAAITSAGAGELTGDPLEFETGTLAGFPSISVAPHEVETPGGGHATNEVVEAFDGTAGYGFMCQYTDGSRMESLCDDVLETVTIGSTDPLESGWTTVDSGGGHTVDLPPGWGEEPPAGNELIHAALFVPDEDIPLAEFQMLVEPIQGDDPPPRRFVNDFVYNAKQVGFELVDRTGVSLASGSAERLVLRAGNTRLIVFALVRGHQGITVGVLTFSDQATMDLLAPTVRAIAESLAVED